MRVFRQSIGIAMLWLVPGLARAATYTPRTVIVDAGFQTTIPRLIAGLVTVMLSGALVIATTVFLVGAFMMVASAGEEEALTRGKRIMKGAAIGYAIIIGAWLIESVVGYLIGAFD